MIVSVFGQVPLGFIFAYLIYRKIVKFGEFWQAILYVPDIISVIVLGIMWKMIFFAERPDRRRHEPPVRERLHAEADGASPRGGRVHGHRRRW